MGCSGGGGHLSSTILSDMFKDATETDNKQAPGVETIIIAWIMGCVAFPIIIFIGLWLVANSLEVGVCGFIGLGLWGAGRYGTNNSLVARLRYRTTKRERLIIARRLSEQL